MRQNRLLMVGEIAKKMGVSVRTLQYYDRQGLLKPTSVSEGGRRLYSNKDVIKLYQILSFKYLGFSLDEIKEKIFMLDEPQEVMQLLTLQEVAIINQLKELNEALKIITVLKDEVSQMGEVDFEKYSEAIEILRLGNDGFWVWKNFDDTMKKHLRDRFENNPEAGIRLYDTYTTLLQEACELKQKNVATTEESCLDLARRWWDMILEVTGGDMNLLPQLEEFGKNKENWNQELAQKQKEIDSYLANALNFYLSGKQQDL